MDSTASRTARAWAEVDDASLGSERGELVSFDGSVAVVELGPTFSALTLGRAVWLVLGVEGEQAARVPASIVNRSRGARGCRLSLELADAAGQGRRRHPRVPFGERVEVIGISDRAGTDPRSRGVALDLSVQGLAVTHASPIRLGAQALLRFALPPHRSMFQVRASVRNCERISTEECRVGFLFERVTATHVQQLQAAIIHIARG